MKQFILAGLLLIICNQSLVYSSANPGVLTAEEAATVAELNNYAPFFGTASYYSSRLQGRPTASGERYDREKFTAACNILPLGTVIRVTNVRNGKSVRVRVNDRLSKKIGRIADLSGRAASTLGYVKAGLTRVKVEVMK
ncbi:MAG: septal ring lytic transglycosylase RlpA family protein [Flavisolibacter sp.]